MKLITITTALLLAFALGLNGFCFWRDCMQGTKKEAAYVPYFKSGDILYPDYACPDTLIVRDAIGLNKAFAPIEQGISGNDFGDMQYDSLFHVYCTIK